MKKLLIGFLILTIIPCVSQTKELIQTNQNNKDKSTSKIHVLNFGTIHLSGSTDAYSSVTNINNPQVKLELKQIVGYLAAFKPTIICVEIPPESTEYINETLKKYKIDQTARINYSEEVNVIGLEVARLSGAKKIYGIDNPIGFDYPSLIKIANSSKTDSTYVATIMNNYEQLNRKPILEQYQQINTPEYKKETFDLYNHLATMSTAGNFEGADIIAEFYKRNLRMYANFSKIEMNSHDRILIIMGATHTAYFDIFLGNSPKYILEDASKYTNYSK